MPSHFALLLLFAAVLVACGRQRPCPPAKCPATDCPAASSALPPPQALAAELFRSNDPKAYEVRFHNAGRAPVTLLRPRRGELELLAPGRTEPSRLRPASYQFEATAEDGRVYRSETVPWWSDPPSPGDWFAPDPSDDPEAVWPAAEDPPPSEAVLTIPPRGTASVTLPLPLRLPAGRYSLRFRYDYFVSSDAVPLGWFTGTLRALPVEVEVGPE